MNDHSEKERDFELRFVYRGQDPSVIKEGARDIVDEAYEKMDALIEQTLGRF